ncbi:MAG: hypothetical protein H0V84_12115 [Actinobacteria bacterium]|nr:hypothetical protein [Actinomycetota bacterium]
MSLTRTVSLVAAGVAALAVALPATAAAPTKGGLYTATITGSTQTLVSWIKLQVRPDGKSARVAWSCNNAPPPAYLSFKIKADGTFKGVSNPSGHLLIWYIQGRFVSKTEAKVYLSLNLVCAGKGVHTVLKLRS